MFSLKIIDTDEFLDMPPTTQNLYFHLGMRADDDGFVSSPKKIMKIINSADDDIKVLISKKFVIPFENGVCVISHWKTHNYIQKDRYEETRYLEQKSKLTIKNGMYTKCIQSVDTGKVRLGKDNNDGQKKTVDNSTQYDDIKKKKKELLDKCDLKKFEFEFDTRKYNN